MFILWLISLFYLILIIILVVICLLSLKRLANKQFYYASDTLFEKLEIEQDLEWVPSNRFSYKPIRSQLAFKDLNVYGILDCVQLIDQFCFSYQRNTSIFILSLVPIVFILSFLNKILSIVMLSSGVFTNFLLKDILAMTVVTCIYMPFLWKHYKNNIKTAKLIFSGRIKDVCLMFRLFFLLRLLVPLVLVAMSLFLYITSYLSS